MMSNDDWESSLFSYPHSSTLRKINVEGGYMSSGMELESSLLTG